MTFLSIGAWITIIIQSSRHIYVFEIAGYPLLVIIFVTFVVVHMQVQRRRNEGLKQYINTRRTALYLTTKQQNSGLLTSGPQGIFLSF